MSCGIKRLIRNSAAELLIFAGHSGEQSIDGRMRAKLSCTQEKEGGWNE